MPELKITEIKETKKGRYALFCADGFLFSVDDETLLRHHIAVGKILSDEEIQLVRASSDYQRAKNKALDLLGIRDHAENELYRKLCRTFDEHTSALAVSRVKELGLLNDEQFAKKYSQELIERKGMSRASVKAKLYEKGVGREYISELFSEAPDDETDSIRAVVQKKYINKLRNPKGRELVFAALMRRGFSSRDIKAVLSEYDCEVYEEYDV